MDLSKVYDCLTHDLSVAKREAYGLDKPNFNLVNGYLRFRRQRKQTGSLSSHWVNVTRSFSQRSILGPLLFNIFINDIFLPIEGSDICKFADNNTLLFGGDNLSIVLKSLIFLRYTFKKYILNSLTVNPEKFQFIILQKCL